MNTLTDTVQQAACQDGQIVVTIRSGVQVRFPVTENPRLARGTEKQLNNIEISPFGLHWPDLDEDLSLRGILKVTTASAKSVQQASRPRAPAVYLRSVASVES